MAKSRLGYSDRMERKPHFRKIDDEWYVRGPLEALGGQVVVTVRKKDNSEVFRLGRSRDASSRTQERADAVGREESSHGEGAAEAR